MTCHICSRTDEGKESVRIWPNGLCGFCLIREETKDTPKPACKNCGSRDWHQIGSANGIESCSDCGYKPAGRLLKDKMERDIYLAYGSGPTADKTIQAHRFNRAKTEASLGPEIKQPPTV